MNLSAQQRLSLLIQDFLKRNRAALDKLNASQVFAAVRFAIYEESGQFAGWQICINDAPRYRFGVDDQLQPTLEDAAGHPLAMPISIPLMLPATEKRILWRINEAGSWFKSLISDFRGQLPAVLEVAMLDELLWRRTEFIAQFMQAPLLRGMAQRLIWGIHTAGQLRETFRISEDATLVNIRLETIVLPEDDDCEIGMVHPALLTLDERHAWGVHLHDYQIVQPFTQIGRDVYTLADAPNEPTPQGTGLVWTLEAQLPMTKLWDAEAQQTGWTIWLGGITTIERHFPRCGILVIVTHPKFASHNGRILTCRFKTDDDQKTTAADVPPIVLSEALYLIMRLLRHDA
jgi:hypothetical protein